MMSSRVVFLCLALAAVQGVAAVDNKAKPGFLQHNKQQGACMDMCKEIHEEKSLQECQHACGNDVTYGDAGTSVVHEHVHGGLGLFPCGVSAQVLSVSG